MNVQKLLNEIKHDEGLKLYAYLDTRGLLTIGWGRLIDRNGGGITKEEADYLLANDVGKAITELDGAFPWLKNMAEIRQRAIANMAFQMGLAGLLKFKTMINALANGNYNEAADAALNSLWAKETPERAKRVSEMIRLGENYQPT